MSCQVVFVGALRARKHSVNFERVVYLLTQTLRSICNQTLDDYRVVIACDEIPLIDFNDDRVVFVPVLPFEHYQVRTNSVQLQIHDCRKDKARKYVAALQLAKKYSPRYIMFVDLDDFINSHILAFLSESRLSSPGWYVNKGYVWDWQADECAEIVSNFDYRCGSSLIIPLQSFFSFCPKKTEIKLDAIAPIEIDRLRTTALNGTTIRIEAGRTSLNLVEEGGDPFEALDANYLLYILGSHRWAREYFGLHPLPFHAVVQNKNTGENHHLGFSGIEEKGTFFEWSSFYPEDYRKRHEVLAGWSSLTEGEANSVR
jgi:hypothetical protein